MNEQQFESILEKYPELIESDLELLGRQVYVFGKKIDLLFKDKHGEELIIELKKGVINRKHLGQLLDYEGYFLSPDNPTSRTMIVGNRVPPRLRRVVEHHGFEWREITIKELIDFLTEKNDKEFLKYFEESEKEEIFRKVKSESNTRSIKKAIDTRNPEKMGGSKTRIEDRMADFFNKRIGQILTSKEIKDLFCNAYPGEQKRSSVIPPDYCYNKINMSELILIFFINRQYRIFESLGGNSYKVIGTDLQYEGAITWKDTPVGKWDISGQLYFHRDFYEKVEAIRFFSSNDKNDELLRNIKILENQMI